MATRKEKQEMRAERYRTLAAKAEQQSDAAFERSRSAVAGIPAGQPILVGHHSERKHRNVLDRSWNALGQSVKLSVKAEYYRRKAEAAENNDAIYTEDDDAVSRLEAKLAELERAQEQMKECNRIVRNRRLSDDEKVARLTVCGLGEDSARKLLDPKQFGGPGFASFTLSNNNANIRRVKERLEYVKKLKATPSREYEINGVRVRINTEANRVQLIFSERMPKEFCAELKRNGFRWAPSNGCYQSYLNRYQIDRANEILRKIER